MANLLLRKSCSLSLKLNHHLLSRVYTFCSKVVDSTTHHPKATTAEPSRNEKRNHNVDSVRSVYLSPLFRDQRSVVNGYDIELVDNDTWQVKSGLIQASSGSHREAEEANQVPNEPFCEQDKDLNHSDFDEIDNMRIRGNLFYKIDRDSREYEEYSYDFHRRKSAKRNLPKKEDDSKPSTKKETRVEKVPQIVNTEKVYSLVPEKIEKKKVRTPTFNQLTGPYHEPFCLDIFISKASVRACVVHRATSKVVAVAHSISKDIKFDLNSTRNVVACVTVGEILAKRALEDDIHNVIYTPRKGEKIEGKLQVVLQSIINNGVNVKVKLKQRNFRKVGVYQ